MHDETLDQRNTTMNPTKNIVVATTLFAVPGHTEGSSIRGQD
jgi:hypothetical protein